RVHMSLLPLFVMLPPPRSTPFPYTTLFRSRIQIVLDDFICTNPALLTKAIKEGAGNASLIKLNQIGTVTETLETIRLSRKNGYKDRKSTRLNSSHVSISYAVFCLKKKTNLK